jgi:hypothetical protein
MASRLPISTAPRDGTLIRFWCRSLAEPIADQAAARAVPLEQVRRAGRPPTVVVGTVKARRPSTTAGRPGAQAGSGARPLMAQVRADAHELPTPRSMARASFRVQVVPSREGC